MVMDLSVSSNFPPCLSDTLTTIIEGEHICVQWRDFVFKAAIGENGVIAAEDKIEGDLRTPAGRYRVTHGYYRPDKLNPPHSMIPFTPLEPTFGWCDEPSHAFYNQRIDMPFAASHEKLWRNDDAYDLILVTNHNTNPIVPGKGSAVFIHVARENFTPSAGCLTLQKQDLLYIVENCSADLFWQV